MDKIPFCHTRGKLMENPEFCREYDALEAEFALSERDFELLLKSCEDPPAPNAALLKAAGTYCLTLNKAGRK